MHAVFLAAAATGAVNFVSKLYLVLLAIRCFEGQFRRPRLLNEEIAGAHRNFKQNAEFFCWL